ALALADAVAREADGGSTHPVSRSQIRAEAALLASQALLNLGRVSEALARSESARASFLESGEDPFCEALCDQFSANALCYLSEYRKARRLVTRALRTFSEYGQEPWMGRAELTLGTLLAQQGRNEDALPHFDRATELLDPALDVNSYAVTLVNQGSTLAHLGQFGDARSLYARALVLTRRHDFPVLTFAVELGLAEIDFLSRLYDRAGTSYARLAIEALARGLEEQALFSTLYQAECEARLGRSEQLRRTVAALRSRVQPTPFQEPAFAELFACLDRGDLEAGLIEHVREALEDPGRLYRKFREAV
ncbi:MAG: tetratricopeptide repeat protein, partial [Thermoanaerobaculia bacterium]